MKTVKDVFPNLNRYNHTKESESSSQYNCIAWAFKDSSRTWWPDEDGDAYWPDDVPAAETQEAFVTLVKKYGYEKCDNSELQEGYEKLALYCNNRIPTHIARQKLNGKWTSKLGWDIDIEHTLNAIEGPCYGNVTIVFRRRFGRKKKHRSRK